jgi:hypothetical protein
MDIKEPAVNYGQSVVEQSQIALQYVSIRVPLVDLPLLKTLANKMGWIISSEKVKGTPVRNPKKTEALKKLRGCISLPDDFDYKSELEASILSKYKNL